MRIATDSDAAALTALINLAFQVEAPFIEGDRIDLEQVRGFLGNGEFLIEENGDTFSGCVYIELRGDRSYLGLLSVDPKRQGNGLGSRLMAAAEARCRELGSRFMDLRVVSLREELPGFYGKLGYVEVGTAPIPGAVPLKMPAHYRNMSKPL